MLSWCFQRHLEMVLYNRTEGGSTGAIYKLLQRTGMGRSAFHITTQGAVDTDEVTQSEFDTLMQIYKDSAPSADPSSINRARSVTILPLATAAAVVRTFGSSPASLAFLRAFSQPVPRAWELEEQHAEATAAGEVDYVLEAELEDAHAFELDETTFGEELMQMAAFEVDRDDEGRMAQYALERPPASLLTELDGYIAYRTQALVARRSGGAVVSATAEGDKQSLLRFYGFLTRCHALPEGASLTLGLLAREDLGDLVQAFVEFLQERQKLKFSSIANYVNGIASIVSYVYVCGGYDLPEAVTAAERTPLSMLINLRNQAEKESKTQALYEKRVGGFMTWEEAQKARVAACAALAAYKGSDVVTRRGLLRDATAISLMTLIPPDRVGVIRKLRLGHTLKEAEAAGGWRIDLSQQRNAHKTSKFYGPYAAKLPEALWPLLTAYATTLRYEVDGETAYLFHPVRSGVDRPLEGSAWTAYIKRAFKKHHGEEVTPKTLRSAFITWLRDSTNSPEVLKSAVRC